MLITKSMHEAALDELVHTLNGLGTPEEAGIHGPRSTAWRVNAALVNFLGAGRAILLQLAHPYVAYAIADHSSTLQDVRSRFQATFDNVFQMTFGTRSEAISSARQVYLVHSKIHGYIHEQAGRYHAGHRYQANDVDALLWVHATLTDTSLCLQRLAGPGLSQEQQAEFYQASKRFALLFGLGEEQVPKTLGLFQTYVDTQLSGDSLVVTQPAKEMGHFVLQAPTPRLRPLFVMYRALTAQLLPERFRVAYGLSFGKKERAMAATLLHAVRTLTPRLPHGLRFVPAAVQAEQRLGLRQKGRWSALVERGMKAGLGAWN